MRYQRYCPAVLFVAAALLAGCASTPPLPARDSLTSTQRDCIEWFQRLDDSIDESGVRDAEAYRLPGFPYLRSNRFIASFAGDVMSNREKFRAWSQAMRELDQRSRDIEIQNLPAASIRSLGLRDKDAARENTTRCAGEMLTADSTASDTPARLQIASRVPDSYSTALRALGLYPLTSIPFFAGVNRWQMTAAAEFISSMPPSEFGKRVRYAPATASSAGSSNPLPGRPPRDGLGIPQLSHADSDRLLAAYAPIFEIETASDDDRIGTLVWQGSNTLAAVTAQPAVYRRIAFTRFQGNILTQLIYTAWFPRRPPIAAVDLLAGELDGVIVRITLGPDGQPMIADSIHACGCYHMFFPGPHLKARPPPHARMEWAFVPATLPAYSSPSRLIIRLAAVTHYITGIGVTDDLDGIHYHAINDDTLRALPITVGETRSIYGAMGLIAGSERGERFLFWPMGIASVGAMRQWGHHATAFVGRRHFDDADLLEKRFELIDEVAQSNRRPTGVDANIQRLERVRRSSHL